MINFGFILRLSKNFEVDELAVVNPKFPIDHEEVLRFAAQGKDYIDKVKVYNSYEEALEGVKLCTSAKASSRDSTRTFILPWEIRETVGEPETLSLVFGRESVGLTRDELSKCDLLVHIPASKNYPVLNLSHAVAILLYEVWKQYRLERGNLPEKPSEREIEVIKNVVSELSEKFIGDEIKRNSIVLGIIRLINKATKVEARDLLYVLSRCSSYLKRCEENEK